MKQFTFLFLLLLHFSSSAQTKSAADFGFKHLYYVYQTDTVDVLIKSFKGEEQVKKPLFFFCQGSQPKPLIIYDDKGLYGVFPFTTDSLAKHYHLVIVGKPGVPLSANAKSLGPDFNYTDQTGKPPKAYSTRNLLSYYSARNTELIHYLQKQNWVSSKQLVLAGHSEGSTIVAKMALHLPQTTHVIYAGGNPLGRIMSIIQQSRAIENDSTKYAEEEIKWWKSVVENKNSLDDTQGDTDKATFEFSVPPIEYLEQLKMPVLISYGTKDWSAPFNDYLRVDVIRKEKLNFSFQSYVGLEHNYFKVNADNSLQYGVNNWDKVALDWLRWLEEH